MQNAPREHSAIVLTLNKLLFVFKTFLFCLFLSGRLRQVLLCVSISSVHPSEPAMMILSNADDMVKWIKFNLNAGKTESGLQLLDGKLLKEMQWATTSFDPDTVENRFLTQPKYPVDEIQIGYGYGWVLSAYRGIVQIR